MRSLFLSSKKYFLEWAYITSGEGMDYHIVHKSGGFPKKYENKVISLSLVPAYMSPSRLLKRAVRVFSLNRKFVGLSFIEYAGRDELNRPARMASNLFLVDRDLYSIIQDPLFYREYIKKIGGKGVIEVNKQDLLDYLPRYYNLSSTKIFREVVNLINETKLSTIVSALYSGRKVVIFGGERIEIYDIESNKKITSFDFIRILLYLLPKIIKQGLEYLTNSSTIHVPKGQLIFIDKSPEQELQYANSKEITIINFESDQVINKFENRLGKKYANMIISLIEEGDLPNFLLFADFFIDSYLGLLSIGEKRRKNFRRMEILLQMVEDFLEW